MDVCDGILFIFFNKHEGIYAYISIRRYVFLWIIHSIKHCFFVMKEFPKPKNETKPITVHHFSQNKGRGLGQMKWNEHFVSSQKF